MHFLKTGADLILILGGLFFIASCLLVKSNQKIIFKKYLTPGFTISLGFMALFLIMAYHVHLSSWDEFTHWGPHDKLVYLNNGFIHASDVAIHKSYPLGGALFHYLFFRITGYSVGEAYAAQCLLLMAPLSILVSQFNWSCWKTVFIAYSAALLILMLLHVKIGMIGSLYMDHPVGVFVGMAIVAYFLSEKKIAYFLYLIPIIIAFTLFKQKLLPFVMMIAFVFLIDQLFLTLKTKKNILNYLGILLLPVISILITKTWHHHLNLIGTHIEWKMHFTLSKLWNAFSAPSGSTPHTIILNYLKALKKSILFLVILFLLNGFAYLRQQTAIEKKSVVVINITLFFGFLAYAAGLLLMYLFAFTTYEGIQHASFYRYLSIFNIAWGLTTLHFITHTFPLSPIKNKRTEKIIVVIMIALLAGSVVSYFVKQHALSLKNRTSAQLQKPLIQIADAVKKVTSPNASVFTIWQNSRGFERAILLYNLTPRKPNLQCTSAGKPYSAADVWTCNITQQQLEKQMASTPLNKNPALSNSLFKNELERAGKERTFLCRYHRKGISHLLNTPIIAHLAPICQVDSD